MPHRAIAALEETLGPQLGLSKSRVQTLCLLVVGMVSARTVNLSHLACERAGTVQVASTYRRLQRFFQHVELGPDWSVWLIVRLLGLGGSWYLVLDRTQWRIGGRDVNLLVLAAVTARARVPLMWSVLPGRGCSDTTERIALMRRYLAIFDVSTIRLLLADREFIGADWLEFLSENNIPFAIRLKGDMRVTTDQGHELTLAALLRHYRRTRTFQARLGTVATGLSLRLNFAAKRLKDGELLIVAANIDATKALAAYRKRWEIECLFGDTKTRGLNLEDTRLTEHRKLDLLIGLVALAIAWASRTASRLLRARRPKRKTHGYFAKSRFRIGFDHLRYLLRSEPDTAAAPWHNITLPPPKSPRVV